MRSRAVLALMILAGVYLAAHLWSLAPALEERLLGSLVRTDQGPVLAVNPADAQTLAIPAWEGPGRKRVKAARGR